MDKLREVTSHRCGVGANEHVVIKVCDDDDSVDVGHWWLPFWTAGRRDGDGVTVEAFLAVAADRLLTYQEKQPCLENGEAVAHLHRALESLHRRTRRVEQEKTAVRNEPNEGAERVEVTQDGLRVGTKHFPGGDLSSWAKWSDVAAACQKLDPPVTAEELKVLEDLANVSGSGGKNGFSELKQVLARTRKV